MNILVIDDDCDLLKLIRQSLQTTYQVSVESDVTMVNKEQLQKADLIILDVMMPKMNGFEFLRKYREIIDAPVIFLTATCWGALTS
ncbi:MULTISPECIES: response regulator [Enterococcus]|uniref:response regulator n=1 Tax=Enterococcus TaxID=1350 RepID=UPI001E400DE9|nr:MULTISPECIES: response regulator [Enterococcus]